MEEIARVVDTANGIAWVEKERQTQCGGCRLHKGCGSAVLAKVLGVRRNRIQVIDLLSVDVGDTVVIQLDSAALLRGSFAVYMIPLFSLFFGAIVGKYFFALMFAHYTEGVTAVFALLGLFFGVWWLRQFSQRIANDNRYQPVISSVVDTGAIIVTPTYHRVT